MNNFFEQELRKLFGDGQVMDAPVFVGRACLGGLDEGRQARAEFVTAGYADHYSVLLVTVLDNRIGVVDKLSLRLGDVLGTKQIPNNPNFPNGLRPHIWVDNGKAEWYAYQPGPADYQAIRKAVAQYLDVFREHTRERVHGGPKLVYICAPLRGDVENNIAFARQKAREVFLAGDVPVCPHLMFPPIASPEDPVQDQAARDMGLRLVESCQQVNVYGDIWTDGMWAEIDHANKLGIPVMSDQRERGKSPSRPKRGRDR